MKADLALYIKFVNLFYRLKVKIKVNILSEPKIFLSLHTPFKGEHKSAEVTF